MKMRSEAFTSVLLSCVLTETCSASLSCLWARRYNTALNLIWVHHRSRVNLRCTGAAVLSEWKALQPVNLFVLWAQSQSRFDTVKNYKAHWVTNKPESLPQSSRLLFTCIYLCCNTLHNVKTNRQNPHWVLGQSWHWSKSVVVKAMANALHKCIATNFLQTDGDNAIAVPLCACTNPSGSL